MNRAAHHGLLAAGLAVLLGIACGTSEGTRLDSGGRDAAAGAADGKLADTPSGGAGGPAGTGGTSTGGGPGTGGATTMADGGSAPERRDSMPVVGDSMPTEAGTDQTPTFDGGTETRGPDTAAAETGWREAGAVDAPGTEAAGREAGTVDAPADDRPADGVLVDGALDPGVDLSDCPNPHWLDDLVNSASYNRPGSIDRYNYQGAVVFYTPPRYADQYSSLYDRCGRLLCHPDGGFTGRGDGQCPRFFDSATGRVQVWSLP